MDLYSHVDCPLEPVRFASLQERPAAREVIVSTIHTNSVQGTRSLQPPDVLACALNPISVVSGEGPSGRQVLVLFPLSVGE